MPFDLLIVPYGIETLLTLLFPDKVKYAFNRTLWNWNSVTNQLNLFHNTFNRTLWNWNEVNPFGESSVFELLIVPYGIETGKFDDANQKEYLLIVPYGIETIV